MAWYAGGKKIVIPASVAREAQLYRTREDVHGGFFTLLIKDDDARIGASELYAEYQNWAVREGISEKYRLGLRGFGIEARRRGFDPKKSSSMMYKVRIAEGPPTEPHRPLSDLAAFDDSHTPDVMSFLRSH